MTVTFVVEAMAAANAVRRKTRLDLLKQVFFVLFGASKYLA